MTSHISSKFKHNFDLFWLIKVLVIIKTFHKSLYFNFVQKSYQTDKTLFNVHITDKVSYIS